ncbi:MAG: gamma-glutamylcyclotransferase family protein, partial [Bacteroidota bacterium]
KLTQVLSVLDTYEGISSSFPKDKNEYLRTLCPVTHRGIIYQAWVYVFQQSTQQLVQITSGDYLAFLKDQGNASHQAFIDSV